MGCGKTSCSDIYSPPSTDRSNDVSFDGLLMVTPPDEFEREELQNIRDRARRLSIPTSARKTEEEWQYKKIADAANILDALYARDEQELSGVVTITTPTVDGHGNCPYGCCSSAHTPQQPPSDPIIHRQPFLGGYRKKI